MKTEGYRFSRADLLENPEKYEYSEFLGSRFLDLYRQNRTDAIDLLSERIERIERDEHENVTPHSWVGPLGLNDSASWFLHEALKAPSLSPEAIGQLVTKQFLSLLISASISDPTNLGEDQVLNLVRRFEISKKVHDVYKLPSFQPKGGAGEGLLNYCLFGTLLAILCPSTYPERQLVFFNALLKVNDILVSAVGSLSTPAEHYLALVSLKGEEANYLALERRCIP